MSTIITIKGTNGSGKSSVFRSLIAYLGKAATLRFNQMESGYRCRYGDGALFVLGKYKTACGGLDSSFSYKGAADDVMLCLDTLAAKGHVVCEGLIAVSNYGFARVTRFVDEQKAKGNHVIFARLDTPVELCVQRVRERRRLAGNRKPFSPEHLFEKHEALLCIQEKLGQAGYDARILPHEEPLQTLLRWFEERQSDPKCRDYKPQPIRYQKTPEELRTEESAKVIEGELSKFQTSARCETSEPPALNTEVATGDASRRSTKILGTDLKYGVDFRKKKYRREVFLRFYQFHTQFKLHPGLVYLLIPYMRKRLDWNLEQLLWFCFINGNTQHPPTSWLIFKRFSNFATLDTAALSEFFNSEWKRLEFDTDRRHQKRDFPQAVNRYKELCGDSQEEYFAGFINGSDEEQNFRSAWATVRRDFYGFGRLSAFSYLEYLRIARLPLVCDQLFLSDINGSKSHRNGLCKVLGRDDWDWHDDNPVRYTPEMIAYLEGEGAKLLADARDRYPSFDTNYFTLESALCAYKNWFRGRRYPGIYADMFYERVTKAARRWPEEDFGMFWDAYRTLPDYVQSETGVSREKQARFRDTGQVIAMGNVWDCFMEQPMWHDAIYDLTPVEKIGDIWFKREDKFSPDGAHNGSKFRQLIWLFSRAKFPGVVSGAVTGSPQLPMVAACAKHYGMKCVQFTGAMKGMALAGKKLGAKTKLVNPGYAQVLSKRAKDYAARRRWLRIETNITVTTSDAAIEAFHRVGSEQVRNLPEHMETLIIPAGSRNSAVSVLYGLHRYPPKNLKKVIFMHIHKNLAAHEREMWARLRACGVAALPYQFETHDVFANGYTNYEKLMPFSYGSVAMHARYEGKCFNYMKDHRAAFRPYMNDKTLFWIVGSEPQNVLSIQPTI